MKDGLRFVDYDMHIMEPPDLFERHRDVSFNPHFDSNVPNVSITCNPGSRVRARTAAQRSTLGQLRGTDGGPCS